MYSSIIFLRRYVCFVFVLFFVFFAFFAHFIPIVVDVGKRGVY